MVIIGLVLVIAAVIFGVDLVKDNRFDIRGLHVFGSSLGIHGSARLFVIGVIVGAAIVLGLALIAAGFGRRSSLASRRREDRRTAASASESADSLRAENLELRRQIDARNAAEPVATRGVLGDPVQPVEPVVDARPVAYPVAEAPVYPAGETPTSTGATAYAPGDPRLPASPVADPSAAGDPRSDRGVPG